MAQYYLESNALNSMTSMWIRKNRSRCYTSYLTILEICSGINAANFEKYQGVLRKITTTGLRVNWRTPQQLVAHAFGVTRFPDKRPKLLENTLGLIVAVDSYVKSVECSEKKDKYWPIRSLQTADAQVAIPAVESSIRTHKEFKVAIPSEEYKALKTVLAKSRHDLTAEEELTLGQLLDVGHQNQVHIALSELLKSFKGNPPPNLTTNTAKYDGTIDVALFVDTYRILRNAATGEQPATNEFFDTSHLMYLNSINDILVTDDRKLNTDVKFLYPDRVIMKAELIHKIEESSARNEN